jgi:hypothetical protein
MKKIILVFLVFTFFLSSCGNGALSPKACYELTVDCSGVTKSKTFCDVTKKDMDDIVASESSTTCSLTYKKK